MPDKIRVAVVDDHPMMRDGIAHTLNSDEAFEVVGTGGSKADALVIARSQSPDIMLLDVSMPGGGVAAAEAICAEFPDIAIVMLTIAEDEKTVNAALRAGARGYVLKGVGGTDLLRSLKAVAGGEIYISPSLAGKLLLERQNGDRRSVDGDLLHELSVREAEILTHVSKGLSNKEIALLLGLSEKTIKHHMTSIFQKLQVRNRVEAALMATKEGP